MVNRSDIIQALLNLGVRPGMGVIVHSSLKSLGYVNGGAKTVVEALMAVVTEEGTILMPSFNHATIFQRGGEGIYDPLKTSTINGAIPESFWHMPGVFRSLNPTHPIAAWGKKGFVYTRFHHRTLTMGIESPIGQLYGDDGYGLLLGVDYGANTFHHVVETITDAPCLGKRTEVYPVRLPGNTIVEGRTWGWREKACPFTDYGRYPRFMVERNFHKQVLIGEGQATLFRLKDCFGVVTELLQYGMNGYPPCSGCQIRPRKVSETVESDWDEKKRTLLPNSKSLCY